MHALLLLFAIVPSDHVKEVDVIEWNSFYDDQGRLVLDQLIFYDYVKNEKFGWRYDVVDWRLIQPREVLSDEETNRRQKELNLEWFKLNPQSKITVKYIPEVVNPSQVIKTENGYLVFFLDKKANNSIRKMRCKVFHKTDTMYDPELVEREFLEENKRKKL